MFKTIVFLAFTVVACFGAPPSPQTYCGVTPNVYRCLDLPRLVSLDTADKCERLEPECEKITCIFRESNWLKGTEVDKTKISSHFEQNLKDQPEWSNAVQHLKTNCLGTNLKAQGVHLYCPAYDVAHCILAGFIKHATPSQWSTSEECTYPRAFAAACPICPSSCFAAQIPIGSCNACYSSPPTS